MTEILCYDDSYLKEFEAAGLWMRRPKGVELDRTAFYPGGGGQPDRHWGHCRPAATSTSSRGYRGSDGKLIHDACDREPPPVGARVPRASSTGSGATS